MSSSLFLPLGCWKRNAVALSETQQGDICKEFNGMFTFVYALIENMLILATMKNTEVPIVQKKPSIVFVIKYNLLSYDLS